MSYLIPRALSSVHDECCGVCVIPVSEDLYKFYEKFGFETAFWISEQVFEIDGNEPQEALPFQAEDLDAHYDAYLRKYAKNGFVFKSKERFSQAVKEYLHPTQPCEFFVNSQGFAFLQKASSEILVREWTGDATRLASELSVRYRLPVRIQYPPRAEDKKPIEMLHSFSDSLSAFAKEHNLYLNCMYN
ncbi:MAG: hypothetical protein J6B54_03600 [Clostridia bacterium]|nr:hypothetical protein [Clostridia bacterium]